MKITEIRLSKTFSAVILIIVTSIFLLPLLSVNFMFWLSDRGGQVTALPSRNQDESRVRIIELSLKNLRINDQALFDCISELALELARLPQGRSGGIASIDEIERLGCPDKGIVNLEGLDALKNLSSLHLQNNNIVNIDALAKLHELQTVDLSHNKITHLDSLAVLPKLKKLHLSGNQPNSIKPLLKIISLEEVDLPDTNQIYCIDIELFFKEVKFTAHQNQHNQTCRGEYSSEVARIAALKKAGVALTADEERLLLEHELNMMKKEYKRKYQ